MRHQLLRLKNNSLATRQGYQYQQLLLMQMPAQVYLHKNPLRRLLAHRLKHQATQLQVQALRHQLMPPLLSDLRRL